MKSENELKNNSKEEILNYGDKYLQKLNELYKLPVEIVDIVSFIERAKAKIYKGEKLSIHDYILLEIFNRVASIFKKSTEGKKIAISDIFSLKSEIPGYLYFQSYVSKKDQEYPKLTKFKLFLSCFNIIRPISCIVVIGIIFGVLSALLASFFATAITYKACYDKFYELINKPPNNWNKTKKVFRVIGVAVSVTNSLVSGIAGFLIGGIVGGVLAGVTAGIVSFIPILYTIRNLNSLLRAPITTEENYMEIFKIRINRDRTEVARRLSRLEDIISKLNISQSHKKTFELDEIKNDDNYTKYIHNEIDMSSLNVMDFQKYIRFTMIKLNKKFRAFRELNELRRIRVKNMYLPDEVIFSCVRPFLEEKIAPTTQSIANNQSGIAFNIL